MKIPQHTWEWVKVLEEKVKAARIILQDLTQLEEEDIVKLAEAARDECNCEYEYRREVEDGAAGACACGGFHRSGKLIPGMAFMHTAFMHTSGKKAGDVERIDITICEKCGALYVQK